nr:unnamed protein product [Digitaria exilis]
MGYCHVEAPVYLKFGDSKDALVNNGILDDEEQGDAIGEYTPDVIVTEFVDERREATCGETTANRNKSTTLNQGWFRPYAAHGRLLLCHTSGGFEHPIHLSYD